MSDYRFSIHAINVNGIVSRVKRHELSLHMKRHNPDVVLLTETGLNNRHNFEVRGYASFRNDKTVSTRGTCIFVKNTLVASRFIPTVGLVNNDFTSIKINCGTVDVIVVAVYFRTNSLDNMDLESLFSLQSDDTRVIVAGDFNARHHLWGNCIANTNGRRLFEWMRYTSHIDTVQLVAPSGPTFSSHIGSSTIDLFLCSRALLRSGYEVDTAVFPSDHHIVMVDFTMTITQFGSPPVFLDYSAADWNQFRSVIDVGIESLGLDLDAELSNSQIDSLIDVLDGITKNAIQCSIPARKLEPHSLIKLDDNVIKLIQYKRRCLREWHRTGRSNQLLKSIINRVSDIIKQLVALARAKDLESKARRIRPGPNLFAEVRKCAGIRKFSRPPSYTDPLMRRTATTYYVVTSLTYTIPRLLVLHMMRSLTPSWLLPLSVLLIHSPHSLLRWLTIISVV